MTSTTGNNDRRGEPVATRRQSLSGGVGTSRGFTLLEMLVVLVLMVLAAGLVLPAMLNSGSAQIRSAVRVVAAGLQSSREFAVNQQQSAVLVMDVNRRAFRVPGQPRPRRLAPELKLDVFTARSELLDSSRAGIRFFPDGSSSGGRISMSRGTQSAYVDVDWLTGLVRVHSGIPPAGAERLANRVRLQPREGS